MGYVVFAWTSSAYVLKVHLEKVLKHIEAWVTCITFYEQSITEEEQYY